MPGFVKPMPEFVLALDAGTSSIKAALVDRDGEILGRAARAYAYSIPRPDHVELDFELLWQQAAAAVEDLGRRSTPGPGRRAVGVVPRTGPADAEGAALRPAIIHLDRRSLVQAREALRRVGSERFLSSAANLPFPGGISLTSALWIRDEEPDLYGGRASSATPTPFWPGV